jgi:hypothetical protein
MVSNTKNVSRKGAKVQRESRFEDPALRLCVFAGTFFLMFMAPAVSSSVARLQPGTLCERSEKIVFSCRIRNPAKIVSLCASKELTKDSGYLQYRFGLPGKIELEFPKQREQGRAAFKYKHYFRAQFDITEISFSSDGYEYTIFDDYNGEQKPAHTEQGIRITTPANKESTFNCRGRAKAQYGDLASVLDVEPD